MPLAEGKTNGGVSFRFHKTRKHGATRDKYWIIRHTVNKKQVKEGLGYSSTGMTELNAFAIANKLKENKRINKLNAGQVAVRLPESFREMQELLEEEKRQEALDLIEAKKANTPFNDFFEEFIKDREADRPREELVRNRAQYKKWAKSIIGNKPPKAVTLFDLKRIVKAMTDGEAAARTIIGVIGFIGHCYNHHITFHSYTGVNPVNRKAILPAKIKKHDNKRERYLTHKQAQELLTSLPEPAKTMALLSLHMGFRAGELFKMTWADVNFNNSEISIRDTKSGKPRTVAMTAKVKSKLESMTKENADKRLFCKPRSNQPLTGIPRNYKTTVDDLGFNDHITDRRQRVVFHTLRHTCASWLVRAGMDLYTVKEVLGHSSILVTERYVHGGAKIRECANIMDKITQDSYQEKIINEQ